MSLYSRGSAGIGQDAAAKADKELTVRVKGAWVGGALIASAILISGAMARTGSLRMGRMVKGMFGRKPTSFNGGSLN